MTINVLPTDHALDGVRHIEVNTFHAAATIVLTDGTRQDTDKAYYVRVLDGMARGDYAEVLT